MARASPGSTETLTNRAVTVAVVSRSWSAWGQNDRLICRFIGTGKSGHDHWASSASGQWDEAVGTVQLSARVAVVIVTHNSADILGDCLRSVAASTVDVTAVVVADNASKDDS